MSKLFKFDVGVEVEHVRLDVVADSQELAERQLQKALPYVVFQGEVVNWWVNTVTEHEDDGVDEGPVVLGR